IRARALHRKAAPWGGFRALWDSQTNNHFIFLWRNLSKTMVIPTQTSPFARKLGTKRKRRPKQPGMGPPSQATFGHPKPPPPPQKRWLDWHGLRHKGIHYHPNYLRRLWQRGDFPRPFKPSPHRLAWWEHDVDAWLLEKAGASGQKISPDEQPATI